MLVGLLLVAASCAAADDWVQVLEGSPRESSQANRKIGKLHLRSNYRSKLISEPPKLLIPDARVKSTSRRGRRSCTIVSGWMSLYPRGAEIYSWHGENKFSSSSVGDVVRTGPISSGGFVGFLQNIFLTPGVLFSYSGRASINGVTTESFQYTVPLAQTGYHVQAKNGKPAVPFHGSFSVNANDLQLISLEVIADDIPADSSVCSAETEMNYQSCEAFRKGFTDSAVIRAANG